MITIRVFDPNDYITTILECPQNKHNAIVEFTRLASLYDEDRTIIRIIDSKTCQFTTGVNGQLDNLIFTMTIT